MDVIRRIRSRRKSKENADAFTTFADAEASYQSGSSDWRASPTRTSTKIPRRNDTIVDRTPNHDQSRQPKSSTEYRRLGSSNRIQPMLIGISGPFASSSRPGTGGSIQDALDRAAESVMHPHTHVPASLSSPVGLRAGRYIDILAISSQTSKPTRTHSEDVAERNLDTLAVRVEGQHYRYAASSKYQEDVAARNARQIAAQRAFSTRAPTTSDLSNPSQDRSISAQSGSYNHKTTTNADSSKVKPLRDNVVSSSRQNSVRHRDTSEQLPIILQEQSTDDLRVTEQNTERIMQFKKAVEQVKTERSKAEQLVQTGELPSTGEPLPVSSHRNTDLRDSGISSYTSSTKRTSEISESRHVRRSKQEQSDSSTYGGGLTSEHTSSLPSSFDASGRPYQANNQDQRRQNTGDVSRKTETSQIPFNVRNHSFYRRVTVGNRTIMDLTMEEDIQAISVASYVQAPDIEDARADALQKVKPNVIDNFSNAKVLEIASGVPRASWLSAFDEPVLDLDQLARRSQALSESAKAAAVAHNHQQAQIKPRPQIAPTSSFTFSPIQTLTSPSRPNVIEFSPIIPLTVISPRSSQDLATAREPGYSVTHLRGISGSNGGADDIYGPQPEVNARSKSSARISADITPLVRIFADVKPEELNNTTSSARVNPQSARSGSEGRIKARDSSESSKKAGKRRERSEEDKAILRAAKSIIPAGPLDEEPMPGVKTRDFATLAFEKPSTKRVGVITEHKSLQADARKSSRENLSSSKSSSNDKKSRSRPSKLTNKVSFDDNPTIMPASMAKPDKKNEKKSSRKTVKQNSSATRKARPVSMFDEEAYQKKHAEANAALLRLQQSLQESMEGDVSQSDAPFDGTTPDSRALSPAESVARGRSPASQKSPTAAAMAMITAATSSPRPQIRPGLQAKASSDLGRSTRNHVSDGALGTQTEGTVLISRSTTLDETNASAINHPLTRLELDDRLTPSPGEVLLSAFPMPASRPVTEELNNSPPAYVKDVGEPDRRESQGSRVSSTSAFSIPFTMVPSRFGSLPEYRMGVIGPANNPQMNSIDSIIPPTRR